MIFFNFFTNTSNYLFQTPTCLFVNLFKTLNKMISISVYFI